jgi:enamine deaminase RidA (YjgF/YER057c/UK114 family)
MFPGDVENQTRRTLDNIEMLLKNQGASLSDMAYMVCYTRNPKHFESIREILNERVPGDIPLALVLGAVCRPGWLVEMDGLAILPDKNPYPPFF